VTEPLGLAELCAPPSIPRLPPQHFGAADHGRDDQPAPPGQAAPRKSPDRSPILDGAAMLMQQQRDREADARFVAALLPMLDRGSRERAQMVRVKVSDAASLG
jgi:hypothetical protein